MAEPERDSERQRDGDTEADLEPEPEPEPEPRMIPVMTLVELQARGSVLLRPAEHDEPGSVVHPMARSNPLGRHLAPPAGGAVAMVNHTPSPVVWHGPAVALFALPGGGAAALENACPRASTIASSLESPVECPSSAGAVLLRPAPVCQRAV